MKRKINPNRMELFRLRRRLLLAQRGHKLLKDKFEGLVREVADLLAKYHGLRKRFDEECPRILERFVLAAAVAPGGVVAEAIEQNEAAAELEVRTRRVMGLSLPQFVPPKLAETLRYSLTRTPPELDVAFAELRRLPPMLFELAEAERALVLLADELGRTRRRTNALEYVLIPELQADRRDIEQKISERERSNISRLMKVKDMLVAGRQRGRTAAPRR